MSDRPQNAPRPLPGRPNLRHLKDEAKDLLRSGGAKSLTDAQFHIARLYGFASWPKLKAHIDSLQEIGRLKLAIDRNDLDAVKAMMTRNPALHHAPLGYGKNGPLTWAAECRTLDGPPPPERLAIARWMIENGSDIHQGGDGPLMRAALNGDRVPMMELLLTHGANVNAAWGGAFPILFAACEVVSPVSLRWLLEHGADPNCPRLKSRITALDYLVGSYVRSDELSACIELLAAAGGRTRYDQPGVLEILRDRTDLLAARLDERPKLVNWRFEALDIGTSGARRLTLRGATLLHVAAEYGNLAAATLLLERGMSANAAAWIDETGVGGQTPIFHAVTQFHDRGLPMVHLLLRYGADLSLRVKLPGHYERLDEIVECTPLGYALRFPGDEFPGSNQETIALLREQGATE
ncbi:MAG TPA: ankyrin repeat domain-containing protein [Candidatus Limnocylindrales bacterium]|nr:ankyrin repeat domain-containing protein [Candidatus Limnocylindrales bacterium]